jgi:hypothetical protein
MPQPGQFSWNKRAMLRFTLPNSKKGKEGNDKGRNCEEDARIENFREKKR